MLKNLWNKLIQNISLKLIALVLSSFIWLMITNSNNPVETMLFSNVNITLINEDSVADIGKVVEPVGDSTVTVRVRERRSILNRLARNGSDFYVEANLENITEMSTVPLTVSCANAAVTWDEIEISPSFLKVNLEDKVEQAFPVSVSTSGLPVSDKSVGSTTLVQGKSILIAGPASLMNIINQVSAQVSVGGLSEDTTLAASLRIFDKNGAALTESQMNRLELKDSNGTLLNERSVEVFVDLWRVVTGVGLTVETDGEPADGYKVSGVSTIPQTVTLTGTDKSLEQVGGKLKLMERVSVAGASEDITEEINLGSTLEQFDGLRVVDDEDPSVSVTVQIEKSGDHKYSVSLGSIEVLNRPDNMRLVFTPADVVPVSIHTEEDDLRMLDEDEIDASMDLSVCSEEGIYEIPLTINVPEGYEVNGEVKITVNATPANTEQDEKDTEVYITQAKPGAGDEEDE